jgi:hypothetical protein
MLRNVSICIFALVVVLLYSSDASACRRSRACGGCGSGYGYYSTSYGCCGSTSNGCCGSYSNGSEMATGAATGTDTTGTATTGTDTTGRARNPGGIGGPASGVGVRPGVGAGGLGRGR